MDLTPNFLEILSVIVLLLHETQIESFGVGMVSNVCQKLNCIRERLTFSFRGKDNQFFLGKVEDGVREVVSTKKPADDGYSFLVSSIGLPIDKDDAIDFVSKFLN